MGILSTFLGLALAPRKREEVVVEKQEVDNVNDREEMKLAQLEYYMTADDNQGIVNLALYL